MLTWNMFNMPKIVDVIWWKWLFPFMFKVWGHKHIKVSSIDEFQICVEVLKLKINLTLILVTLKQKIKAKQLIVLKYTTNVFILSLNEYENIQWLNESRNIH